jgi:uncharacterized protein YlxW (UPF0749 family)
MRRRDMDKLVADYADSDRSDTFISYNDAIELAREVRRLQRKVEKLEDKVAELELAAIEAHV